jgi:hypothetical protein
MTHNKGPATIDGSRQLADILDEGASPPRFFGLVGFENPIFWRNPLCTHCTRLYVVSKRQQRVLIDSIPVAIVQCGSHGEPKEAHLNSNAAFDGKCTCKCSDGYTGDLCDKEPAGTSSSKSSGVAIGAICTAFVVWIFIGIAIFW